MKKPEAIIFDLDGTLWDAVPTYTKAWNLVFQQRKLDLYLHPDQLYPLMGMQSEQYLASVLPEVDPEDRLQIYQEVVEEQYRIIPSEGGNLFPSVKEGLFTLSSAYKLIILSNCPPYIIHHFIEWAGIKDLITDHLSYGESPRPKSENMQILMERNQLNSAIYVGDTESDGVQARKAGIPFAFVSYGFGQSKNYDQLFNTFKELVDWYMG